MYVCMHVCMYVCMHVFTYVCMCMCVCMFVSLPVWFREYRRVCLLAHNVYNIRCTMRMQNRSTIDPDRPK